MSASTPIEGLEFDWYAVDDAGSLAVFATGLSGPVPPLVRSSAHEHHAISDSIEMFGWGTPEVWKSYSRLGLFAYDWHETNDCFVRVAAPTNPPPLEFARKLHRMGLLRLHLVFSETLMLESRSVMTPNTSLERTREG